MYSQSEVQRIVGELRESIQDLFSGKNLETILFGSCARADAEDGSDIDVLFLVDVPRHEIANKGWQIGEAAANLLLEHGIVISPIVENRDYFHAHATVLPFYRNIQREGVRISA